MLDSDDEDVSLSSRGRRRKARKIEYDSEQVDLQVKEQTKNTTVGKKRGQKFLPQKSSMKKAEQSLLSKLEKQVQVAETQQAQKTTAVFEPLHSESSTNTMISSLQEQNVKLLKENAWLKSQVLTSLKVFPTLVEKLTNQVESRCTSAVSSPCSTSTGIPSTIPSTPEPVAIPINVIDKEQMAKTEESIPHDVVAMCQSTDPRKMTNKLLKTVFGTEHLGTHSLTGNAGSKTTPAKPAFDSKKVMAIINLVVKTFSNESERTVRHYITDYLNNSAKSLRATISLSQSSV